MKFNVKWFSITALIIGTIPFMGLFIWCSINGFGIEIVKLFESVHPSSGYSIFQNMDKAFSGRIPGIIIDTVYAALDSFILGFSFSGLYNFFVARFS